MSTNRLQPINLTDFTGGLNLRRNQFQLADNESPDLLNVDVDPRGGFYTRKGWTRWSLYDISDGAWKPRNLFLHTTAAGAQIVYATNNGKVWRFPDSGVPGAPGITCAASPHLADFMSWGDDTYVACGRTQSSVKMDATGTVTGLGVAFSEVVSPIGNVMPQAEFVESHIGYNFIAYTREGGNDYPTRIRWSHPNRPDAWAVNDYIDIGAGGGKITGLVSFQDHLLIFKESAVWGLYGYDKDSWQLARISTTIGAPHQGAIGKSETGVYFFSAANGGGIYGYSGGQPVYMSEKLQTALEQIISFNNVFVSFAGRRLWVAVPWTAIGGDVGDVSTLFAFDPSIGSNGAWTMYSNLNGGVASVIDGSSTAVKFPLANFWSSSTAGLIVLDAVEANAYDAVTLVSNVPNPLGFSAYYRTRWVHGGAPDLRKSWRKPTFICRQLDSSTILLVESFRDYDQSTARRANTLSVSGGGVVKWGDGHLWGDGSLWNDAMEDGGLLRAASFGHASSMQLKISAPPSATYTKWGVDGIILKVNSMRFRT